MGYEEKIAAAVIIAGAFCGYGISPMSDFVNLLSSSVEIELAKTLKAERNSIIPTICVCLAGCFMRDGRMRTGRNIDTGKQ